jgi:hypothetical protein
MDANYTNSLLIGIASPRGRHSFSLMNSVQTAPAHFGFIDVTDPCLTTILCSDPDHTFWDTFHPSLFSNAFVPSRFLRGDARECVVTTRQMRATGPARYKLMREPKRFVLDWNSTSQQNHRKRKLHEL